MKSSQDDEAETRRFLGLPEPVVDGVSYVAWAASDMQEQITVERSSTVSEFLARVHDEFFLRVERLLYLDGAANTYVDLLLSTYACKGIADLVPPGSRLWVNGTPPAGAQEATSVACSAVTGGASPSTSDFDVGQRIKVVGLRGRPELNGKKGSLVRWVAEKGRWEVRLDSSSSGDSTLGLKPENMESISSSDPAQDMSISKRPVVYGALIILCDDVETGPGLRQKLSEVPLKGGSFEQQLHDAGIRTCVFPYPKGAGDKVGWFDHSASRDPKVQEDIGGIACSMELVDGEIDKLAKNEAIPSERIGILGHGSGGCMALHLAYGGGRYARELGAVACERGFLSDDTILYQSAASVWRMSSTAKPSAPLFMGHGSEDHLVQASWMDATRCYLGAAGVRVPAEVVRYPGSGHDMCANELQQLVDFFVRHLLA